ncbi:hypothetical protein Tco_1478460 [Tanacetum coccineum]
MKLFQDMQLIQKLRDDQKRMKKVFKDMSRSYKRKSNQDWIKLIEDDLKENWTSLLSYSFIFACRKHYTHDAGNINNVVNNVTTVVPTSDGNGVVSSTAIMTPTPGMSTSYANVTSKPSRNSMSFRTLITPAGNGVNVVVPVESIRAISERFVNTTYGFFLGKRVAYPVVANYV